jgi:hypothetical protein
MASFASKKSPDKSIPLLTSIITYTFSNNDESFTCTIYPNPHNQKPKLKRELIKYFGNRIQNDKHCLGITEDTIIDHINIQNYCALISVENNNKNDSATAALQYYDWYGNRDKQLWIANLCRVNGINSRGSISPVRVLFDIINNFSNQYNITENYLMVEKDKPGTEKLLEIYGKYGFKITDQCSLEHMISMKKSLSLNSNNINRLKNKFIIKLNSKNTKTKKKRRY